MASNTTLAAGRLRHQVSIQRPTPVLDSNGDETQAENGEVLREWVEIALVWAAIEPLSAREFIQSSATQAQVTARITMRYRSNIYPTDRLVHIRAGNTNTIYGIEGILSDKDSGMEYLTLPVSHLGEEESIQEETYYLLTASGDFLTTASGDSLTWS